MTLLLLCFCCTLMMVPGIVMRYEPFTEETSKKQRWVLSVCYTLVLLLNAGVYCAVYTVGEMSVSFYKCNLLVFAGCLSVINALVIRNRSREHFFTFGLTAIITYMITSVTAFIQSLHEFDDIIMQIILNAVIFCVLFTLLYPFIRVLMRNTITPFLVKVSREYWTNFWFIPTAMLLASLFSAPMEEYISTPRQLISHLLIGIATLFVCRCVSFDYVQLKKREELSNSLDRQKEYYDALSEKVDEARKARHDFKHHTSLLKAFADKGDYSGMSEYISELTTQGVAEQFIPFTGNSAADGVIYHYVLLCEKENIRFETEGVLQNTGVADIDLCVLLGNALDNAVTACETVSGEKYIQLSFLQKDGLLTVTVQNSFDGILLESGETVLSRKRKNDVGIGLRSMKEICEKYHGNMCIGHQDNVFSVMLLLESEKL